MESNLEIGGSLYGGPGGINLCNSEVMLLKFLSPGANTDLDVGNEICILRRNLNLQLSNELESQMTFEFFPYGRGRDVISKNMAKSYNHGLDPRLLFDFSGGVGLLNKIDKTYIEIPLEKYNGTVRRNPEEIKYKITIRNQFNQLNRDEAPCTDDYVSQEDDCQLRCATLREAMNYGCCSRLRGCVLLAHTLAVPFCAAFDEVQLCQLNNTADRCDHCGTTNPCTAIFYDISTLSQKSFIELAYPAELLPAPDMNQSWNRFD